MSLGLGSVIASALDAAPWLITAGRYKGRIFLIVGGLLAVNYWLAIARPRRAACAPGEACHVDSQSMRINRALFWLSVVIYITAITTSYATLWWVRMQP